MTHGHERRPAMGRREASPVDGRRRATVRAEDDHGRSDWSPYEVWRVTGWPLTVLWSGAVAMDSGRMVGEPGSGPLAPRSPRGAAR